MRFQLNQNIIKQAASQKAAYNSNRLPRLLLGNAVNISAAVYNFSCRYANHLVMGENFL